MIEKANYSSVQHKKESVRTFMLITEQKNIQIQSIFILKKTKGTKLRPTATDKVITCHLYELEKALIKRCR